jgi:membrane protein
MSILSRFFTRQGRTQQLCNSRCMKGRWKGVLGSVKDSIFRDRLIVVAPGVAFYMLLGLLPGVAALVLIYSLVADPLQVQAHFAQISPMVPPDAAQLLNHQIEHIAEQRAAAGWSLAVSIGLMLWAGSYAMAVIVAALNITFDTDETRGFIKLTLLRLVLAAGAVALAMLAIGILVAVPGALALLPLSDGWRAVFSTLRWPLLLLLGMSGLSILYQLAPDRPRPRFRWLTWGSASAAFLWVVASSLFSVYFGRIDATQALLGDFLGAFGAVVVMMLWMLMSAFVMLMGAELDAALERHPRENDDSVGRVPPARRR